MTEVDSNPGQTRQLLASLIREREQVSPSWRVPAPTTDERTMLTNAARTQVDLYNFTDGWAAA